MLDTGAANRGNMDDMAKKKQRNNVDRKQVPEGFKLVTALMRAEDAENFRKLCKKQRLTQRNVAGNAVTLTLHLDAEEREMLHEAIPPTEAFKAIARHANQIIRQKVSEEIAAAAQTRAHEPDVTPPPGRSEQAQPPIPYRRKTKGLR